MAVAKTLKFIKTDNGTVLLQKTQDNSVVASFEPSMSLYRENGDDNRFRIASSTDDAGFLIDYRHVNGALCIPVIADGNLNDFLTALSSNFFFLAKLTLAQTKIYRNGELLVFKIDGNVDYTTQEPGDYCIGFIEGQMINADYLGGDKTLLANYNI